MQREHLGARAALSDEDGFTLLELMMVILIIGILIAVLTPTFLGASNRAKDRAVEASLTSATTGAKSLYLGKADYSLASPAAMTAETGGLTYVDGVTDPTNPNTVSVQPIPANTAQIILAGKSNSGFCFYVLDDESTGVTKFAKLNGTGNCHAQTIDPTSAAWQAAW